MTNDLMLQGISAVKTINDTIMDMMENHEREVVKIQGCLSTITDVLETCLVDMIKAEEIEEKLKDINKIFNEQLNRVSAN